MAEGSRSAPPRGAVRLAVVAGLVAAGAALRLWQLGELSLAYDGIQSVTHAGRPFPLSLLSALLHDPHPPLYYLLLGAWTQLGRSDAAVLLLSCLLSLALVPSVYRVGVRWLGVRAALVAAAVCALHPLALYWSHYARMYALVMLLALWAFHWNLRLLNERPGILGVSVAVVVTELALVYSHLAAAFALPFVWGATLLATRPDRLRLQRWGVAHAVVAVGMLPYLYYYLHFPLASGLPHPVRPGLADGVEAFSLLLNGLHAPAWLAWSAAGVWIAAVALLVRLPGRRAFALALLLAPFAVAAALSHVARPFWLGPRTFAFVVPFVALAVGALATADAESRRTRLACRAVAALALALLAGGAASYTLFFEKKERFVDVAREVRAGAGEDDVVLVPTFKAKWAFERYFTGPDWDRALWTGSRTELYQSFTRPDSRRALVERVVSFGSRPGEGGALRVLPAEAALRLPDAARRVWIVARNPSERAALVERFGVGGRVTDLDVAGLEVALYERMGPVAGLLPAP